MTVTETAPEPATSAEPSAAVPTGDAQPELTGLAAVFATGHHIALGRLWIVFASLFGLFTIVLGELVALERVDTDGIDLFVGLEAFFQTVVLYRVALVFLFVVPLFIGIATAVVPLQLGATSVSFPRAATAAFWTWVVGGGVHIGSVLADGGFNAGGRSEAIELSLLSFGLVVVAVVLASICLVTTVVTERPVGMPLSRVPLFSWSILVAGSLWVFTLPVVVSNVVLSWVDLRGAGLFFDPAGTTGFAAPGSHDYLSWVFDQPQVFLFVVPVLGLLGDIVPTAFRTRQRMYGAMQAAIAVFGVLAIGAYAQTKLNPNASTTPIFVVQCLALLLPILGLVAGWADTVIQSRREGNRPRVTPQLGLAAAALLMLLAGGAAAALRVLGAAIGGLRVFGRNDAQWQDDLDSFLEPLDDLAGTSIASAVFNYVLLAGLIGAVAAITHWSPRVFGRILNPALSALTGLALLGGTVLYSLPDVITGFLDQPDLAYRGPSDSGVEELNTVVAIGGILLFGGVLLFVLNLVVSVVGRRGEPVAPDEDPWDGGLTLEWNAEALTAEPEGPDA